jgi:hypothetical protein
MTKDVADTAAEWLDAVTRVIHLWFEYRDDKAPIDDLIAAVDQLIRVQPAYKGAVGAERAVNALNTKYTDR